MGAIGKKPEQWQKKGNGLLLSVILSRYPLNAYRDATAGWATCLLTQTGFLRLSLNPQVVGVSIDCQAAVHLLRSLVAHPYHQYTDIAPALTTTPFDELMPKIVGYRQVSDATLLHLARVGGLKLVTFDRPVAAMCPWPDHLELLTP